MMRIISIILLLVASITGVLAAGHRFNVRPGVPAGLVAFVGSSQAGSTTGTLTCPVPTGTQNGDFVLTYLSNNSSTAYTGLQSWNVGNTAVAGSMRSTLYFRFASSEPGNYMWTGLGTQAECAVRTYRNVAVMVPFDDLLSTTNASATSLATSALVPTVSANEMNVNFWSALSNTQAISGPGGLSNTQADNTQISVYSGNTVEPLSGTTVTARTASIGGASVPWISMALNLIGSTSVPATLAFTVTAPTNGQTISGSVSPFTGNAGSLWAGGINIYQLPQPPTQLITTNVIPSGGSYSGSYSTTVMANGAQSLQAVAFRADGTPSAPIPISVTVSNALISFIGQVTGGSAVAPGSLVVNLPTGTQIGDVVLAYAVTQSITPGTTPAGWSIVNTAANTIQSSTLYWKIMTSGDISTGNVTFASVSNPVAQLRTYRGAYTAGGNPIDTTATCQPTSAASCTIPALVPIQTHQEVEAAFFDYNVLVAPTCPATLGNVNSAVVAGQRGFCAGDVTIANIGQIPSALTSTGTTANYWDGIAATLLTGPSTVSAPTITLNPSSITAALGATATFIVDYSGSPPMSVQWYRVPPSGGTGSPVGLNSNSYTTPALASSDNGAGFYSIVTNAQGASMSTTAILTVNGPSSVAFDQWGLPNTPTSPFVAVSAYAFLQGFGYDTWAPNDGNPTGSLDCSVSCDNEAAMLIYIGARWLRATAGPTFGPAGASGDDAHQHAVANAINAYDSTWKFKLDYIMNDGTYNSTNIGSGANPAVGTESYNWLQYYNLGILKFIESWNEIANNCGNWNGQSGGGWYFSICGGSNNIIAQFQKAIWTQKEATAMSGKVAWTTPTYAGGEWDNGCLQYGTQIPSYGNCIFANGIGIGTHLADVLAVHPYTFVAGTLYDNVFWDTFQRNYGTVNNQPAGGHGPWGDFAYTYGQDCCQPGLSIADLATPHLVGTESSYVPSCKVGCADRNIQAIQNLLQYPIGFFSGCQPGASTCVATGLNANSYYLMADGDGGYPSDGGIFSSDCVDASYTNVNCGGPFRPRLSAVSLHNMMGVILYDTTANFTPGTVHWTITGCSTGGYFNVSLCHGGLLQKSNGHYFLLVMVDTAGEGQTPTINLGTTFANVNVYSPIVSSSVQSTHNGQSSFTVPFSTAGLQIVEFW